MLNSLYISALGMQAQKSQLDVVSNNLTNTNSTGYKRERVDFSAMLDRQVQGVAATDPNALASMGRGTALSSLHRDLSQGELKSTGSPLDLAINGEGFFEVNLPEGRTAYVRGGSMKINDDGYLTTADGYALKSDVRIPTGASGLVIDAQGVVSAKLNGDTRTTELGRLQLVSFANNDALQYLGNGVFAAGENQEPLTRGAPQEGGLGGVESGKLEMSNVKLVDEMVALMMAQRVYELNSKVVQAADELMSLTNNLRRG